MLPSRVHPLMSFASLSEHVANCHLFNPRNCSPASNAFPGVFVLFATLAIEVHWQRTSHCSSWFRPQRFSRSRRFAPSKTVRACFIPLPHPGFALQGVAPLPSYFGSSPMYALLSLDALTSQEASFLLPARATSPTRRCSRLRSVEVKKRFRPSYSPFPSCAFNSRGLFFETP
jgi:hypothetical protein